MITVMDLQRIFHQNCAGPCNKATAKIHSVKYNLNELLFFKNVYNYFIFYFAYCYCNALLFQAWGDYADMSQAVAVYVTLACNVFPICWFGTQLTQQVIVNGLLLLLLLLLLFLQRHMENAVNLQHFGNLEIL